MGVVYEIPPLSLLLYAYIWRPCRNSLPCPTHMRCGLWYSSIPAHMCPYLAGLLELPVMIRPDRKMFPIFFLFSFLYALYMALCGTNSLTRSLTRARTYTLPTVWGLWSLPLLRTEVSDQSAQQKEKKNRKKDEEMAQAALTLLKLRGRCTTCPVTSGFRTKRTRNLFFRV